LLEAKRQLYAKAEFYKRDSVATLFGLLACVIIFFAFFDSAGSLLNPKGRAEVALVFSKRQRGLQRIIANALKKPVREAR